VFALPITQSSLGFLLEDAAQLEKVLTSLSLSEVASIIAIQNSFHVKGDADLPPILVPVFI